MNHELKTLYRKVEENKITLAKAISLTLKNENLKEHQKLEIIECYIDDYFEDLNYVEETEYE